MQKCHPARIHYMQMNLMGWPLLGIVIMEITPMATWHDWQRTKEYYVHRNHKFRCMNGLCLANVRGLGLARECFGRGRWTSTTTAPTTPSSTRGCSTSSTPSSSSAPPTPTAASPSSSRRPRRPLISVLCKEEENAGIAGVSSCRPCGATAQLSPSLRPRSPSSALPRAAGGRRARSERSRREVGRACECRAPRA